MSRRVLLLFPELNNFVFFGVYEPLVLEIFSAIAKEEGNDVELLDLRIEPRGCERLARTGYVPDMIALTTHGFPEVPIVNRIARTCKMLWPRAAVIIGGGQATVSPHLFDQDYVDLIVRGPGERVWRDLCRSGVLPPDRITEDADPPRVYSYPLPDREITAKYRKHYVTRIPHHSGRRWGRKGRTGFTLLTQGCPFRCSFCVIWHANLGLYRKRPIPEIVADLQSMEESYVYLGDDNTFADAKYAGELADAIRAAGIEKELSSYCRVDHICKHPELLQQWYDIGLRYLVVGIEAVSTDKQLDRFNKKTNQEQNEKAIAILRRIGIFAIPHILISPEMTATDFDEIYQFIEDHEFEYPVVIPLTPLPGTEDFDTYRSANRILTERLDFYTFMYNVVQPASMTPREYDRHYDRLVLRMWSWSRFLRGKCGKTSFVAFLKWWLLVRVLLVKLRWRRRDIYQAADETQNGARNPLVALGPPPQRT